MPLTEKWPSKLFGAKGKDSEAASMMDHVDVPHRPPPPPPLALRVPGHDMDDMMDDDRAGHNGYSNVYEDDRFAHDPFYISSPEDPTSPPPRTFSQFHPMAASPISPEPYEPYQAPETVYQLQMQQQPEQPLSSPEPEPEQLYIKPTLPALPSSRASSAAARPSLAHERSYSTPVFEPERRYGDDDEDTLALEEPEIGIGPAQRESTSVESDEEADEDEDIPPQPPLIVITGAASGLGLALFQHFAGAAELADEEHHKYDVLGIDKGAWRLPGKGFQWTQRVGKRGQYVQLDVAAASAKRLDSWASTYLYSSLPSERRGGALRRFPRPVALLVHCVRPGGLAVAMETVHTATAETMAASFTGQVVGVLQLMQTVVPHLQLHAQGVRERMEEVSDALGGGDVLLEQLLTGPGPRGSTLSSGSGSGLAPPREAPARAVLLGQWNAREGPGGGRYASRAARAALGSVLGNLSIDVPEVCFASVDVGSVSLGSAAPETPVKMKRNTITITFPSKNGGSMIKEPERVRGEGWGSSQGAGYEQSLEEILPLVERIGLEAGLGSGCFVNRFGEVMEW